MIITHLVGIDPGMQGAIAIYNTHEQVIHKLINNPVDEEKREYKQEELVSILKEFNPENTFCILEKQHCMPGEGLPRTFKTGFGFGLFVGLLRGLRIPHQITYAKEWQRRVLLNYPKTMPVKERSIMNAKRFFNLEHLYRTPRSRIDHDGLADALNMVIYGMKFLSGEYGECQHSTNQIGVCIKCGELVDKV